MGDFDLDQFIKKHEKTISATAEVAAAGAGAFGAAAQARAAKEAADRLGRPLSRKPTASRSSAIARKDLRRRRGRASTILSSPFAKEASVTRTAVTGGRSTLLGG